MTYYVPSVLKSGNLNLLEPSGPVQTCNGIALPLGRDSALDIAIRYGLDGPGIESWWEERFSESVHTGPGSQPASYTKGTESLFRG